MEGAAGEPAGEEVPQEEHRKIENRGHIGKTADAVSRKPWCGRGREGGRQERESDRRPNKQTFKFPTLRVVLPRFAWCLQHMHRRRFPLPAPQAAAAHCTVLGEKSKSGKWLKGGVRKKTLALLSLARRAAR